MIQANELRIGNWVYNNKTKAPEKIRSIDEYGVHGDANCYDIMIYDNVDPIPLTPELLGKCGFKVISKAEVSGRQTTDMILGTLMVSDYSVPKKQVRLKKNGETVAHFLTEIQSLHQLQNLYFALTGSELPVNL